MVRIQYHDERSAEQIITQVFESLDSLQGRIERKITLLDTAKHLLGDYCMAHMNSKMETPKELKLVIDLLDLTMSDSTIENDIITDDKKDLDTALDKMS